MRLTQYSNYAMRLLIYCALRQDRPVRLAEIAQAYDISTHHLNKIAQGLNHIGAINAFRGRNGGIRLAKDPKDINVGDVIRHTEENLTLVECFCKETNTCLIINQCKFRVLLEDALEAFLNVLDAYTLEDMIAEPEALKSVLGLADNLAQMKNPANRA